MAGSVGRLSRGDVISVPFPFADLSGSKRRPALVIKKLEGDDLVICPISTKAEGDKTAVSLRNEDFVFGNLPQDSCVIRPSHLFTVDINIVVKKVGYLRAEKVKEVIRKVAEVLELND